MFFFASPQTESRDNKPGNCDESDAKGRPISGVLVLLDLEAGDLESAVLLDGEVNRCCEFEVAVLGSER